MNKKEFVDAVAKKTGLSAADTKKALDGILVELEDVMARRDTIQFLGFGTFTSKVRAARQGLNPQTRQKVDIPAVWVPVFKAGSVLKETVAQEKD